MEVGTAHSPDSVVLEWSDDGGITYTGSRTMTVGAAGQTRKRVFTTRLGSFRNRVFRLTSQQAMTVYALGCRHRGGQPLMVDTLSPAGRVRSRRSGMRRWMRQAALSRRRGRHCFTVMTDRLTLLTQRVGVAEGDIASGGDGVTDGSDAAAGIIGEFMTASPAPAPSRAPWRRIARR